MTARSLGNTTYLPLSSLLVSQRLDSEPLFDSVVNEKVNSEILLKIEIIGIITFGYLNMPTVLISLFVVTPILIQVSMISVESY